VRAWLALQVDTTGVSIGKRYARTDEIGVPFAITVDHRTLEDDTVTLRERDSCGQVRVPAAEVAAVVSSLVNGAVWSVVSAKFPAQEAGAADAE
jgi:glycyl-tRNA synthetase